MPREDERSPVQVALDCAGLSWRRFAQVSGLGQYTVTQFVQGQLPPSPRLVKLLAKESADPAARKILADWLAFNEYPAKLANAQQEWIRRRRDDVDWTVVREEYRDGGLVAAVGLYGSTASAAKAWCVSSGNLQRGIKTGRVPSEVLGLLA